MKIFLSITVTIRELLIFNYIHFTSFHSTYLGKVSSLYMKWFRVPQQHKKYIFELLIILFNENLCVFTHSRGSDSAGGSIRPYEGNDALKLFPFFFIPKYL